MDQRTPAGNARTSDDLSALAWVHEELRRSLEGAHKSLRRFLKEAEATVGSDTDHVDPSVLRSARTQLHQGVGALELVGLPAAALLLRASEAAVQKYVAKPHKLNALIVEDIERASFALLDYLGRMLAGKPVSPLWMFPQYRAVQEHAGAERIHPADLWPYDWRWLELPTEPGVPARQPDEATRALLEACLLDLMRHPDSAQATARMSDGCASLGAGAAQLQVATLWKLAAAFFEAQAQGLLGVDVFSKRVASRLLAQYRAIGRGQAEVSERLALDLLFFCAQAASPGDGRRAPRLAAVRQAYGLVHHVPTDYNASHLGRFDPALIAQARKRVAAAKDSWSGVAGGELHRLSGLGEQFHLVGDSLKKLFPDGERLAVELQAAATQAAAGNEAPPPGVAMEVATALLYVDAALEDGEVDHPEQAQRLTRLAERLAAVRAGAPSAPLEGWMEELYRRVSDRQTMGSVVQELRASLSEVEKSIDQFFRQPADRKLLIPVPNQLAAMRGVLSVLGMDQATAALLRMRDEIEGLTQTEVDPDRIAQTGLFDRIAGNLGALGFLIDMLSVQPQLAKSLFVFDAKQGSLEPVMGRDDARRAVGAPPPPVEPRLVEQAQLLAFDAARDDVGVDQIARELEQLAADAQASDQSALQAMVERSLKALEAADQAEDREGVASVRGELSDALVDFVNSTSEPMGLDPLPVPASAPVPAASVDLAEDDEMREIFLEEAREVIGDARAALGQLQAAPSDLSLLTTVRRAFHTLKGSSRMVGLKEFGEAAWACEQLYNTQLADNRAAAPGLLDFSARVLDDMADWVEAISGRADATRSAGGVVAAAARVAAGADAGDFSSAAAATPVAEPPAAPPEDLLPPLALDLSVGEAPVETLQAAAAAPPPLGLPDELLTLDLSLGEPADTVPVAEVEIVEPAAPVEDIEAAAEPIAGLEAFDTLDFVEPNEAIEAGEVGDTGEGPEALAVAAGAPALEQPAEPAPPLPEVAFELDLSALDAFGAEPFAAEALAVGPAPAVPDLDLSLDEPPAAAEAVAAPEPTAEPAARHVAEAPAEPAAAIAGDDENVKVVGPLRIGIPLFNIYLNEADELSRRLTTEVAEWAMELHRPIGETPIALAHSLAGSSATVGFADLSQLARSLEHAQMRSQAIGYGTPEEARLFVDVAEEIRRLLHQFAAGFLKQPSDELLRRLAEHELDSARRLEAATAAAELEPAESEFASLPSEPPLERITLEPALQRPLDIGGEAAPLPAAEAVEPEPEPDAEDEYVPAEAAPSRPAPLSPSHFGSLDSSFAELGVAELKPLAELPVAQAAPAPSLAVRELAIEGLEDIDAVDAVDAELFPIFEEEGQDLLPQLSGQLRDWARRPGDAGLASACMRTLHTLKGGARLAGAMRLGEMAHRLETRIEQLLAHPPVSAGEVDQLQAHGDALTQLFELLRERDARDYEAAAAAVAAPAVAPEPVPTAVAPAPVDETLPAVEPMPPAGAEAPAAEADAAAADAPPDTPAAVPAEPAVSAAAPLPVVDLPIDWSRFASGVGAARAAVDKASSASQSAVRVRAPLLDRLVNQAGEVSITRSRIEAGLGQIRASLGDLTENLDRLRQQLRDIELQAETQMSSRLEAAKAASQSFDPLEFDRFTRFQEITRMMAESVNDVATVQRTLQRAIDTTEDELATQARLTRDLQDDLLRTRMVEFEGQSDRLYRVVRQAAKETGKQVRMDIVGGSIEVDRGVLDRMIGSFEHLLRNSVVHGIETPEQRSAAGKEPQGSILVALTQEGNEVGVEFRDDGRGLDLPRIRAKAVAQGLLAPDATVSDAEIANLIFTPGFSTAEAVTELAGRGVGMDVVRSEVNAMGGRIETATAPGQGTSFKLILPLTTAVTQVLMLRCGETVVAVPSTLIEIVRRAKPEEIDACYASGVYQLGEQAMPFFWLGALLQLSARPTEQAGRTRPVIVVRSAQQRIALHVDEVLGNQEVVVKNLGPQLSRLPGLAGMTLLASGAVALIYNPVALATLYGATARAMALEAASAPALAVAAAASSAEAQAAAAPLVLVVDDSLTVRRVTQRLLSREGYRVVLAKDGMEALEKLAQEVPQVVLSDIEMPRMDGFDLVRNIRGDLRLAQLPVIMITSRIAQKHRDYAAELGVDHYLGKPYSEEDLLALIGRYTGVVTTPA